MNLKHLVLASLAGLSAAAKDSKPSTKKVCRTEQGTKSVNPVPTFSYTSQETFLATRVRYTRSTITRTPKPITEVDTTTVIATVSTTVRRGTSTVTIIDTEYPRVTSTLAVNTIIDPTIVTSVTTTTITTTISTPANWVGIKTSLPGASLVRGKSGEPVKRDLVPEVAGSEPEVRQHGSGSLLARSGKRASLPLPENARPQVVTCDIAIPVYKTATVIKTKQPTTTTIATPTKTKTKTRTITSTSTIVPAQMTATTISTTMVPVVTFERPSTTITLTTTSTESETLTGPTVHAICQGNDNYADSKNNVGFFSVFSSQGYSTSTQNADNAFACCEACATSLTCIASAYSNNVCTLIAKTSASCSGDFCTNKIKYTSSGIPFINVIYMNGKGLEWTSTY